MRRELAEWAEQAHQLSERRAARLIPGASCDIALPAPLRSAGSAAGSTARTGRQSGALRLLPSDGDG